MLRTQHIALPAQSVNQLALSAVLQFPTQTRDVDLNDVAETFPVEVVEVLEELGF